MNASHLASKIIYAHMSQTPFSLQKIVKNYHGRIGFYTRDNQPIVSSIEDEIDFTKQFYQDKKKMILVNQSTFGHLGVESIVIEKEGVAHYMSHLQKKIMLYLIAVYLFLSVVGYFLAKLFIKPIQAKRIQLDNFIKDSTHELNTPITALMLSLDAPRLDSPKNLERIKLSAKRVSEIYKDLSYLMLEEPKEKIVEKLCLNEIIREELTYLTLLAEKRKVTLSLIEESEVYFEIDKESFVRLFHNLVTNAIKYNKIGGTIEVKLLSNSVIISDTGMGIAKEKQSSIYERFYRATDQVGGFGLGLNIVYKVCRAYGIEIAFESTEGEGTVFILNF